MVPSWKWEHTICELLCLAAFPKHVLKGHSGHTIFSYCISLLPESTCNPYRGPHTPHKTPVTPSRHITFRNLHPNGLQERTLYD